MKYYIVFYVIRNKFQNIMYIESKKQVVEDIMQNIPIVLKYVKLSYL